MRPWLRRLLWELSVALLGGCAALVAIWLMYWFAIGAERVMRHTYLVWPHAYGSLYPCARSSGCCCCLCCSAWPGWS